MTIFSSKKFADTAKKMLALSTDFALLKNNLKDAFKGFRDTLDVHLDSINQNTNEIQTNYENITEINAKIEKLSDKIDEFQMQLNPNFYSNAFDEIKLSRREQEVFIGVYAEEDRISMINLAKNTGLTIDICEYVINNIRAKGIPLIKQLVDGEIHVSIDYTFKDLQARKNVLRIDLASC